MEKFEAIVVGCGPAGAAAALELAKNGVKVLVLERAKITGSKNATGGILYADSTTPYNFDYVLPNFEKEAPLERKISGYYLHAVSGDKIRTVDLSSLHHHNTKFAYSVLRGKFDAWLADQVHRAARPHGGGLLTGVRATGPLVRDGKIVGIITSELEPIEADVVIAADGATSELVRGAGIRDWMQPRDWFQGVKAVLKMPAELLEQRFGIAPDDGVAHLFSGDLFGDARGGGFLYTNKDTLSIGTVFHLDSVAEAGTEPYRYLDRLLTHPLVSEWIGDSYEEVEYSAKLIPDGRKAFLDRPYKDRLLAIGDAANQLQAAGPIIKGMNLGVTAGILAAKAYVEAKKEGAPYSAGSRYAQALGQSVVAQALQPNPALKQILSVMTSLGETLPLTKSLIKLAPVRSMVETMFTNYSLSAAAPDKKFVYSTLPALLAKYHGKTVTSHKKIQPKSLDERIALLTYETDIGRAHIEMLDDSPAGNGRLVSVCPVSAKDSSRGCYRLEEQYVEGRPVQKVVLDTQPCVECGTCAVLGKVKWEHPRGGKGVQYKYG